MKKLPVFLLFSLFSIIHSFGQLTCQTDFCLLTLTEDDRFNIESPLPLLIENSNTNVSIVGYFSGKNQVFIKAKKETTIGVLQVLPRDIRPGTTTIIRPGAPNTGGKLSETRDSVTLLTEIHDELIMESIKQKVIDFSIYDFSGNKVYFEVIEPSNSVNSNVSFLKEGLYVLLLTFDNNEQRTVKFHKK